MIHKLTGMILAVLMFISANAIAQTATNTKPPEAPVGLWQHNRDDGSISAWIRISQLPDGTVVGDIEKNFAVPGEPLQTTCQKCTGELLDKPLIGMRIMNNIRWNGSEWTDGSILDTSSGTLYSLTITQADENTLNLRGYVGFSLFGRTAVWTRVTP